VKQTAGSSTFTYSYQGLNILYEKSVTGSTTTVTKHFYAGALQVAKMVGASVYYLHQDALGSTRLVTNSAVLALFSSNYIPYGIKYATIGKEEFMYTGRPYDSATRLYYMTARYYDSVTGRFMTLDSYPRDRSYLMAMNFCHYTCCNSREKPTSIRHISSLVANRTRLTDRIAAAPFI
jgi:RHS repeat-associated protein